MSYVDILRARRKSAATPSMEPRDWSPEQRRRAAAGRCVQCGERPADSTSYRCRECQAADTIDDVRREIKALRDALLRLAR